MKGFKGLKILSAGWILSLALLSLAGCGGDDEAFPPRTAAPPPIVTGVTVAEDTFYNGGLVNITATVEAESFPERLPVDFYLVPANVAATCSHPGCRLARSYLTGPPELPDPQAPQRIEVFHQIFNETTVVIDPAEPQVRTLTLRRLVPLALAQGPYRVAAAVAGLEGECLFAPDAVQVMAPRAPELTIEYARLHNNSFRLPPEGELAEERLGYPAYSLSFEMGNVGLPVSVPVEVALTLTINGTTFPLLVWEGDGEDVPVLQELYLFDPEDVKGVTVTVGQDSIRGAVAQPHLSSVAKAALRQLTEDTACLLNIVLDPYEKIPELDRANNTASLPVMFLYTEPPLDEAACGQGPAAEKAIFNDCSGTPDKDNPNLIFCFGPNGPPADDSWSGSWMYAGYQFGGSASDPSYLGYGEGTIPESAHFHTATYVEAGRAGCDSSGNCWKPLDLLLDFMYAFPPKQSGGELVFADFQGHLTILGDTLFKTQEALQIKRKDAFNWYKKDKKWTLFSATVDCGFVPLHFSAGAQGELGIGGNVTLTSSQDTSFTADLTLGPYASLSGYGQAEMDFVVCSAGVGVNLDIIDLEPSIEPYIEYMAPTNGHQAAIDIGAKGPLTIQSGNGDFYTYVKVIGHKFKTPIVNWDGYDHTVDLFTPFTEFLGPIGEFLMITDGDETNPTTPWAIYATDPGHTYTWNGRLSLEAGSYRFQVMNMCQVELTPDDGHTGDSATWSCAHSSCVEFITISQGGNYTITASTDPSCFDQNDVFFVPQAAVGWNEDGPAAVVGLSGLTGNPGGTANDSLAMFYFNAPYSQEDLQLDQLAYYTDGSEVDFRIAADNTPQKYVVNTPEEGLWIEVMGELNFPANLTQSTVFLLQVNAPQSGVPLDKGYLCLNSSETMWSATMQIGEESIGPGGTIVYPVDVPDDAGQVSFQLLYVSPDQAATDNPPGARLRMAVAPKGQWLVQTTCLDDGGTPHTVNNVIDGPVDPGQGTLGGGSLDLRNICQSAGYANWQSDYVVGAFDFAADGSYDFFPGALSMAQYTVWVDGVRRASRAVSDATASPPQYPDQDVCVNSDGSFNPQCPVRQNHQVVEISAGTRVIEAYYEQAAKDWPVTTAQANQLRWDPVADGQYLVSFYRNGDELACSLSPYSASCQDLPEAAGSASHTPDPLLMLKFDDPSQAGYALNWQTMPDDCNNAAGNQLDCADSLARIYGCTPYGWPGWFVRFDGRYRLQDQQLYHFEGGTTPADPDTVVDFRLDGQPYARYNIGPLNPPVNTFNPYSPSQFVGVLMNQDPGTASGENEIVLGAASPYSNACTAKQPPPDLSLTWAALAPSTTYAVYFVDESGNPSCAGQGDFGTGATQTVCAGAGSDCSQPMASIPPNPKYLIVGSLEADPAYDQQGSASPPLLDLLARFPSNGTCAEDEPAWIVDMCVNGWCAAQVSIGEPGPEEIVRDLLPSPLYMPYSMQSQSSMAQGLMPQTANSLLIAAEPRGCLPQDGPLQVELSYAQHLFHDLTMPVTSFSQTICNATPQCTFTGIEAQNTDGTVSVNMGTVSNSTCTGPQASCTFDLAVPPGEATITVGDTVNAVPIQVSCTQMPPFALSSTSLSSDSPCQATWTLTASNTCGTVNLEPGSAPSMGNSTCTGMQASCQFDLTLSGPNGGVALVSDGKTTIQVGTELTSVFSLSQGSFRCPGPWTVEAYDSCGEIVIVVYERTEFGTLLETFITPSETTCSGPMTQCEFTFAWDNCIPTVDGFQPTVSSGDWYTPVFFHSGFPDPME